MMMWRRWRECKDATAEGDLFVCFFDFVSFQDILPLQLWTCNFTIVWFLLLLMELEWMLNALLRDFLFHFCNGLMHPLQSTGGHWIQFLPVPHNVKSARGNLIFTSFKILKTIQCNAMCSWFIIIIIPLA